MGLLGRYEPVRGTARRYISSHVVTCSSNTPSKIPTIKSNLRVSCNAHFVKSRPGKSDNFIFGFIEGIAFGPFESDRCLDVEVRFNASGGMGHEDVEGHVLLTETHMF